MANFDLDAYLARIDFAGPRVATRATLEALHALHPSAIAFENVDVLLGIPISLELGAITDKLVHRRRGGYCYEHNLLFAAALRSLGFEVTGLIARVIYGARSDAVTARSHMLLEVTAEDEAYFADVGFGGLSLTAPLSASTRLPQRTSHETFRVSTFNREIALEAELRSGWQPLYRFDLQRQEPIDYELANHWSSTHKSAYFTRSLVAGLVQPGVRYGLVDNTLSTRPTGAESELRTIDEPDELRNVLSQTFGIELPTGAAIDALLAERVRRR
ncbi:MAG: acetyltransferase [Myxococcaceae bacterium]|nr:acetyltransferase [Myxococcaceae bacterium]